MNANMEEQLLDLLCKKAVHGLSPEESNELQRLEAAVASPADLYSLELTAAAIATTGVEPDDKLPDHLKADILAQADEYFAERKSSPLIGIIEPNTTRSSMLGWLGWAAAAAACIALAFNIWYTPRPDVVVIPPDDPPPVLGPEQKRAQFVETSPDVVRAEWGKGNIPELAGLTGDVVWSDSKQEGYLRFRGLPKNDASTSTYQLWIFDETQDLKTPIDGGIFDVNADGEVVVPIDARLKARNPKAFAVTIEKPGGVVVSTRDRVVALAAVKPDKT